MTSGRPTKTEIRCQLLFSLSRKHAWARWVPEDEILRTLPKSERGRGRREVLPELRKEPLVIHQPDRGYKINHDTIEDLAHELRDKCEYSELRIEATLSHFDGF